MNGPAAEHVAPASSPPQPPATDATIAAEIGNVVHGPFREAWRRCEREWRPVREALALGAAAHRTALQDLATGADDRAGSRNGGAAVRNREAAVRNRKAAARNGGANYRRRVTAAVLDPRREAFGSGGIATRMEGHLADAFESACKAAATLPSEVEAAPLPQAPEGATRLARVLWVVARRGEVHRVPVSLVARRHLAYAVAVQQRKSFGRCLKLLASWIMEIERTWAEWTDAVLSAHERGPDREGAPGRGVAGCLEAARKLDHALGELAAMRFGGVAGCLERDLERWDELLLARTGVAGTFLGSNRNPVLAWQRDPETVGPWDRRLNESSARLDLCHSLLNARNRADRIRDGLLASWAGAVAAINARLVNIGRVLAEGRARSEELAGQRTLRLERLKREQERTIGRLREMEGSLPRPSLVHRDMLVAADAAVEGLDSVVSATPEVLVLRRVPRPNASLRSWHKVGKPLRLREAAHRALGPLRCARIVAAPATVREAMGRVHAMVAELREVAAYAFEVAIAEVVDEGEGCSFTVVANGLARAESRVHAAREDLRGALDRTSDQVVDAMAEGIAQLRRRVAANQLSGMYLDARASLAADAADVRKGSQRRWSRVVRRGGIAVSAVRRRLQPVGQALGIDDERPPVVEPLSPAAERDVLEKLPVVYRRLFSFEPVEDSRLLAGRQEALAAVKSSWESRRSRPRTSLMVVAAPGAGATSFLNVAAAGLGVGAARVASHVLRERIRDEASLLRFLTEWLVPDARGVADLDALGDLIIQSPPNTVPQAAILEGVEHLHVRVPKGAETMDRLLAFASRTSPRIFWVMSIASSAWQLVEKRCPKQVRDLERIVLGALSAEDLGRAILARHRLSGIPVRYVEPRTIRGRPLRGLLGRRGSRRRRQSVEADFFQRLHRASLGSIRAALFHWLRCADFRAVEGTLLVRPLETLPSPTEGLELTESFALKAILDHGTLTVAEYGEVGRLTPSEAASLFRSLRDRHLIEAAPSVESGPHGGAGAARHRIRPLLVGSVAAHLRSLNILH